VEINHVQKAHPDAGEFRIWSLLAQLEVAGRAVGRIMALNRLVYDDIPASPRAASSRRQDPTGTRPPSDGGPGVMTRFALIAFVS
jgi:hypothetical protein